MSVGPFPWESLAKVEAAELAFGGRARQFARHGLRLGALEAAFARLLGQHTSVALGRVARFDVAAVEPSDVAVVLGPGDALPSLSDGVLVLVEGSLAAHLAAGALRRAPPPLLDPALAPSARVAGAVAAVLRTALREAWSEPLKVLAAGPGPALSRDFLRGPSDPLSLSVAFGLGDAVFGARVVGPTSRLAALDGAADPDWLRRLGDFPLGLPLVLAACLALRTELAALRPGDVLLIPDASAVRVASDAILGSVFLAGPRSEVALRAELAPSGQLVVRGRSGLSWEPRSPNMPSDTRTLEVLEDVPLVVRVEMGAVEMTARAWAELAEGDVLPLERRVGDPVTLRVGGAAVASGELVVVDGGLGVRVLSRHSEAR